MELRSFSFAFHSSNLNQQDATFWRSLCSKGINLKGSVYHFNTEKTSNNTVHVSQFASCLDKKNNQLCHVTRGTKQTKCFIWDEFRWALPWWSNQLQNAALRWQCVVPVVGWQMGDRVPKWINSDLIIKLHDWDLDCVHQSWPVLLVDFNRIGHHDQFICDPGQKNKPIKQEETPLSCLSGCF